LNTEIKTHFKQENEKEKRKKGKGKENTKQNKTLLQTTVLKLNRMACT